MGTKPAMKWPTRHRPSWPTKAAKPGLSPVTEDLFAKTQSNGKKRSSLRGRTKVAKVGPPRARGVKSAKVPLTPYVYP